MTYRANADTEYQSNYNEHFIFLGYLAKSFVSRAFTYIIKQVEINHVSMCEIFGSLLVFSPPELMATMSCFELSLLSFVLHSYFQTTCVKAPGRFQPNFTIRMYRLEKESLFRWFWPPCSYILNTIKYSSI